VAETVRYRAPTLEQFAEAAEVNYERTPYQRSLDSEMRFRGFQQLGVELAVVRSAARMEAVAYLLPAKLESMEWVYMFQVAARRDAPGGGALLIRQVMQWYPAILGIGITPDAVRIYQAFKWTHFGDLWRCVHPLRLDRMLEDYGARVESIWKRRLLRAGAGIYNVSAALVERTLAIGMRCEPWKPPTNHPKAIALAGYLPLYRAGEVIAAAAGGAGRIGNPAASGLGKLREHAALWREMRRDGVNFCELLAPTPEVRRRAIRLGYWPITLPVWYWDRDKVMKPILDALAGGRISFLETDKVV
jgi:hypothetical protein